MVQIIWVYRVRPPLVDEFCRIYGPGGTWATLFANHASYRGTKLFRDHSADNRFMTIDTWAGMAAYDDFKQTHSEEYRKTDAQCARFFEDQRCIGFFEAGEAG